jgi:glutamate formiminotransferase
MKTLIECVPNFSEGRDASILAALLQTMSTVPGACVLASESDPDHNRSVVTLVGEPEAVAEAALRGVGKAAELIDLNRQAGAHPRIGATDVLPFIPIAGITMEECITLAHRVGREIWDRYAIPVYFYEAAATRAERANLENLRTGQFEGLRDEVLRDPQRSPDIGEPRLHPTAGAIAVGARKLLIAYNIHLNTNDVAVARQIARAIRYSSGGLRYVKAIGVPLQSRDIAQVSINLTDFEQTPLHRVFEMVVHEAEHYGCTVTGSEIVGLIPRKAIEMTAEFHLRLENFSAAKVLENSLEEALEAEAMKPLHLRGVNASSLTALAIPLLDTIAAPTAAPAGGSVTALAGAAAASLGEMVAELTRRKKSHAQYAEQLGLAVHALHAAAQTLSMAMDRDAHAYQGVLSAQHLQQHTSAERAYREETLAEALRQATEVPLETAIAATDVFEQLVQLEAVAPASMLSDLHVARLMAMAAARGALATVAANLAHLITSRDTAFVAEITSRAAAIETRLAANAMSAG